MENWVIFHWTALWMKKFPLVAHLIDLVGTGFFSEIKPILLVSLDLNSRFAALKCSFNSLMEQVTKLAKRLDTLGPTVLQPSPKCQLSYLEGNYV
ncbi:hypothetical protein G9A89_006140 [Geosiphon pyriformis]|nr:hypothetical protein G9A89_006140 [Geosiphon pyriformis]